MYVVKSDKHCFQRPVFMVQSTTGQQLTTAGFSTRPRGTEPHYPHKQQTQPCVFVCACVTGICTDRNEHNYTLVSPQTCRQPSTTENNKKNIMYLLLQLHTTQKTLMYTKIYPHTQPVMRCTFTTSQVPRDPFTSFQHS